MELGQLKQIKAKGLDGTVTLSDITEVVTEHFVSSSKANKAVLEYLKEISEAQKDIQARLTILEDNMLSPIYQAILEDEEDEPETEETAEPVAD